MANYFKNAANAAGQAGPAFGSPQGQPQAPGQFGFQSPNVNPATGVPYAQAPGAMGPGGMNYFNPGSFNMAGGPTGMQGIQMTGNDMTPFQAAGPQPGQQQVAQQIQNSIYGPAGQNQQQQNAMRYQPVNAPQAPQMNAGPMQAPALGTMYQSGYNPSPAPAPQSSAPAQPAQASGTMNQTGYNPQASTPTAPASGGFSQWDPSNPSASSSSSNSGAASAPTPNRQPNYFGGERGTTSRPSSF